MKYLVWSVLTLLVDEFDRHLTKADYNPFQVKIAPF